MPAKPSASKPKGRASSTSTTLRFIRMLRLVPREPRKIAVRELLSRLADAGFPVSRRSVERDLQALNAEGYLQHDDAAMGKGWFTPRNAVAMHVADMTPAEALALHLGGKHLAALLPPAVVDEITPFLNAAERVLKDNWRSERATWRNKVAIVPASQPLLAPKRDREIEAVVYQALLQGKQLDIRYGRKEDAEHCVNPLGLVQRGPVTYLVVRYEGFDNVRILAMHRIRKATACVGKAVPPLGFSLDAYLAQGGFGFFGSSEPVRLSLRVKPAVRRFLEETPLAGDQSIEAEGDALALVSATVRDNAVFRQWIRSLGPDVEVIAPASLREAVAMDLRAAAAQYG